MRLKTKLVLAITGLVFCVVVVFSWIWLSQLLQPVSYTHLTLPTKLLV